MRYQSIAALLLLVFASCLVCGCGSKDPAAPDATTAQGDAAPGGVQAAASDPMHPRVEIATTHGTMTIELDMENAPGTSNNFLEYVNSSHYNGTLFHYVEESAMILGGGFTPDFQPKPTSPPIRNEAHNGQENVRGSVAMSRFPDSIDSATCQFFINLADNTALDYRDQTPEGYGYCVFGKIVKGLDVAEKIAKLPVQNAGDFINTPRDQVIIKSAKLPSIRR